mgnify:CR=1 FL=1
MRGEGIATIGAGINASTGDITVDSQVQSDIEGYEQYKEDDSNTDPTVHPNSSRHTHPRINSSWGQKVLSSLSQEKAKLVKLLDSTASKLR